MNIYGYRISNQGGKLDGKFPTLDVTPVESWTAEWPSLAAPALLLLHGSDRDIDELCELLNTNSEFTEQFAVLFVNSERYTKPLEITSTKIHFLGYGVPTPCREESVTSKFKRLVEVAKELNDWQEVDMAGFWNIVERRPLPETLLAWHLLQLAESRGVVVDRRALPTRFEELAVEEFKQCRGDHTFDFANVKSVLAEQFGHARSNK